MFILFFKSIGELFAVVRYKVSHTLHEAMLGHNEEGGVGHVKTQLAPNPTKNRSPTVYLQSYSGLTQGVILNWCKRLWPGLCLKIKST